MPLVRIIFETLEFCAISTIAKYIMIIGFLTIFDH